MVSRAEYIGECLEKAISILVPGQSLVQYIRKGKNRQPKDKEDAKRLKNRQPRGVLVAYRGADNVVYIGYSLCNTKVDTFNKWIGMRKAIEHTISTNNTEGEVNTFIDNTPQSIRKPLDEFIGRAQRFFKEG